MKSDQLLNRVCNPRELGALASVQSPGRRAPFCQPGVSHWFKSAKAFLVLAGALVSCLTLSPSLHAGIIYSPNPVNADVYPANALSLPITVSSTLAGPDVYWLNAGFNLTWDSSVVTLQSINLNGTPILNLVQADFNSPSSGHLNFSWYDSNLIGYQVPDGSTLFTLNFQTVGGWDNYGNTTPLSFSSVAVINLTDSTGNDFVQVTPTFTTGSIAIVPEPIDWALGLFACLFIGGAAVRWVSYRRMSLQPAQVVSHSESGV